MQSLFRIDVSVKIFHNVDVLQPAKGGEFKDGGPALNQCWGKPLFEADVSVWMPANEGDPDVANPLAGAGEVSHRAVEVGEGFTGDCRRRNHFLEWIMISSVMVGCGIEYDRREVFYNLINSLSEVRTLS